MSTRTLVTGGVRSGKSTYAESLLSGAEHVTYIAPGPRADAVADPDWAARVAAHQRRRPASWSTVETTDVAAALTAAPGPLLLDCLGTWLTAALDELEAWDAPIAQWHDELDLRVGALVAAWSSSAGPAVAVTNEVGLGVVPAHRSGRIFRDWLGVVNQRIARGSDVVSLVVAGRVLHLP